MITQQYDDKCEMLLCTKCGNHGGLHRKSTLVKCELVEIKVFCECGHAFMLVVNDSKGRIFIEVVEFAQ